jgi:hypothetical protein
VARVRRRERLQRRYRRHAVARHDGQQHRRGSARREELRDAGHHRFIAAEHAAQQRSPREVDRERVREAVEGLRRVLGRRDREQRVRQRAAAGGTTRRLGHAGRVRVDADHERVRPRGGGLQHVAAVTGAQVDRDP